MLKYLLLVLLPGVLFSANVNLDKMHSLLENKNTNHLKKNKIKRTVDGNRASVHHILSNKNPSKVLRNVPLKNSTIAASKSSSANLKQSIKKSPVSSAARKKIVENKRRQAAKSRKR